MIKLFKDAFKTANDCVILAIPFVLFMWLLFFYFAFSSTVVTNLPELILAFVTVLFMSGAFLSGWLYTISKGIEVSHGVYVLDKDRSQAIMNLFKLIPRGIGKYFLSFIGMLLIFMIGVYVLYLLVDWVGINLIGDIYTPEQITNALSSTEDMKAFVDSLSLEQLWKLNLWNILIMVATTLFSFCIMLWAPEIIYSTVNPLKALFRGAKKAFLTFKKSSILFIYLTILNIGTSYLSTFSLRHPMLYLLIMVILFYYIIYVVVLVFSYYVSEFCESDSDAK